MAEKKKNYSQLMILTSRSALENSWSLTSKTLTL